MNRVLPFWTRVLIAGTNNKSNRLEVYDAAVANWNDAKALVWAWAPTEELGFTAAEIDKWKNGDPTGDPMDVKLRNSSLWAGSTQVITTVGGEMVIVARYSGGKKGEKLWARNVGAGAYPHSSELLPDGNVAVVATHGNWLRLYNTTAGATNYFEVDLTAPHGVLWDPKNNLLWVVSQRSLTGYSVEGTKEAPSLVAQKSVTIPPNGHDLSAFYNDPDKLLLTSTPGVYVYSKSANSVTALPGAVFQRKAKSISNQPDGILVVPGDSQNWYEDNGQLNSWSTDTVNFYDGVTGALLRSRKKTGGAFYKADVFMADY